MSAAILRINTVSRASPNSPNSRGTSDSDEMPPLIFACDSDSDSYFDTVPALVDDDIEDVHEATTRRARLPDELAGYSFSDFFFDDSPNKDVYDAGPHETVLVFDGCARGTKTLGEIYLLDAYRQKTNANHHHRN